MKFTFARLFRREPDEPAPVSRHRDTAAAAFAGDPPSFLRREPAGRADVIELAAHRRKPAPLVIDRLADTKLLLRTMTYGEFMEYCAATNGDPDTVWNFAIGKPATVIELEQAA